VRAVDVNIEELSDQEQKELEEEEAQTQEAEVVDEINIETNKNQ
jgi:hypothetical protein